MHRSVVIAALCAACISGVALAETSYVPAENFEHPSAEEMTAARPPEARRQNIGGQVFFWCSIDLQGRANDCSVMHETPANMGFADAARAMLPKYSFRPAMRDRLPIVDKAVVGARFPSTKTTPAMATPPDARIIRTGRPAGAHGQWVFYCVATAKGVLENCADGPDISDPNPSERSAARALLPSFSVVPAKSGGKTVDWATGVLVDFDLDTTRPGWLRRPTNDELISKYPANAIKTGLGGSGTIRCTVSVQGVLTDCSVVSESPPGLGFGASALALAPYFLMTPATRNGVAVGDGKVVIPVAFGAPGGRQQVDTVKVNLAPIWAKAPTSAQVAEAFPAKARGKATSGQVAMRCRLRPDGVIYDCMPEVEEPKGLGFVQAASRLTSSFRVDMSAKGAVSGIANLRFDFIDPQTKAWSDRTLTRPRWKVGPDAKTPPPPASAVKVRCDVAIGGQLTGCAPADGAPAAAGAAAVKVASTYVVNPWADDGFPVDGIKVEFPVAPDVEAAGRPD